MKNRLALASILLITAFLLSACGPGQLLGPTITPTSTTTPTSTPTSEPTWMTTIKTQDPESWSFQVIDGKPVIDLYDTSTTETIILKQETIKITPTTDGLNPNILTAQDTDGNIYALNPDFGWFRVPAEVQMDYAKLAEYTEVSQSFIEDGRANITAALNYAENPTISPDAIDPIYWVGYHHAFPPSFALCNNACGLRLYDNGKYPEEIEKMFYSADTKPFAWTGFYKVNLNNGEIIYVVNRTVKNPSESNKDQTLNFFNGFDRAVWETIANNMLPSNRTELDLIIDGVNNGGIDIVTILAPPDPYPFNPDTIHLMGASNPVVGSLQQRNLLISFFNQVDYLTIMEVLQDGQLHHSVAPLTQPLPVELSKHILFSTTINR